MSSPHLPPLNRVELPSVGTSTPVTVDMSRRRRRTTVCVQPLQEEHNPANFMLRNLTLGRLPRAQLAAQKAALEATLASHTFFKTLPPYTHRSVLDEFDFASHAPGALVSSRDASDPYDTFTVLLSGSLTVSYPNGSTATLTAPATIGDVCLIHPDAASTPVAIIACAHAGTDAAAQPTVAAPAREAPVAIAVLSGGAYRFITVRRRQLACETAAAALRPLAAQLLGLSWSGYTATDANTATITTAGAGTHARPTPRFGFGQVEAPASAPAPTAAADADAAAVSAAAASAAAGADITALAGALADRAEVIWLRGSGATPLCASAACISEGSNCGDGHVNDSGDDSSCSRGSSSSSSSSENSHRWRRQRRHALLSGVFVHVAHGSVACFYPRIHNNTEADADGDIEEEEGDSSTSRPKRARPFIPTSSLLSASSPSQSNRAVTVAGECPRPVHIAAAVSRGNTEALVSLSDARPPGNSPAAATAAVGAAELPLSASECGWVPCPAHAAVCCTAPAYTAAAMATESDAAVVVVSARAAAEALETIAGGACAEQCSTVTKAGAAAADGAAVRKEPGWTPALTAVARVGRGLPALAAAGAERGSACALEG